MQAPSAESREAAKLAAQTTSGKKLDPALKSWLDNVIIPALVHVYLDELREKNKLASTGQSELLSDIDGEKS